MSKKSKKSVDPQTSQVEPEGRPAKDDVRSFPIVGLGASAGGLEALEKFLRQVPEQCGVGFVIVQHLDPNQKGMLPELLERVTPMKVYRVHDRMKVKPNCVYVIPPNKDLSIRHGVLHLLDPQTSRGWRLPIDFFFRSLADDWQEKSIGVILSGMGSDGTVGLRAIKEKAGLIVVQEPSSAKFDGMPQSAIATRLADIIAPVEELPGKIFDYLHHVPQISKIEPSLGDKERSAHDKIILLLRNKTGHDFSLYKKTTLNRRIERRMGIHQILKVAHYVRFLRENPQEVELLFKELLIGVTNFFRDPEEWERLCEEVIPWFLTNRPGDGVIRAWVAGCSTGEEAYSLAIIFKDTLERLKLKQSYTLQIFATDLDRDAIETARQGVYPTNISADMTPERLQRYFIEEDHGYRVRRGIREMVTFATQNLISDPPFTKLDLLICRNLLIYLEPELQKKLFPLFHYSLNPNGVLFLGSSESTGSYTNLFAPIEAKSKLYRRRNSALRPESLEFPSAIGAARSGTDTKEQDMPTPGVNLQALADQLILQNYAPPAALVNDQGDILYISGRTGKYLEPAAGKANWNIFAMVREGIHVELTGAFQKVVRDRSATTLRGIKVATDKESQPLDVSIQPIENPAELRGMVLIIFHEVANPPVSPPTSQIKPGEAAAARIAELEQKLTRCRSELQASVEGMQSSQEELKSTNEELQSTNEELQSTNEELTTSKEEMQSMNEELLAVNAEQTKQMGEIEQSNDDLKNLLNSTEIITLFLDDQLNVRRFTSSADKLFKLIPSDVGRPLSDISNDLIFPEFSEVAQDVLRTLVFSEQQVATNDGRWFSVRIMPYRTLENRIDGLVVTLIDISEIKQLEADLRMISNRLASIVRAAPVLIICLSTEGKILEFNPEAERLLKYRREDVIDQDFFQQFFPGQKQKKDKKDLKQLLTHAPAKELSTPVKTAEGDSLTINWTTEALLDVNDETYGIVAVGLCSS